MFYQGLEELLLRFHGGDPPPFERIKLSEEQTRQYFAMETRLNARMNEIFNKAAQDIQKVQMEKLEGLGKIIGIQGK